MGLTMWQDVIGGFSNGGFRPVMWSAVTVLLGLAAYLLLRRRLYSSRTERAEARKNQIGSGDRSERIRTYNFPQNRVTDHRINLTLYHLDEIIQGELVEVIDSLKTSAREAQMQSVG